MKSYEEMAREVLEYRDREVARRRIIRKRAEKIVGVSLCACAAICILIGVTHSKNLVAPLPDVDIIDENPHVTTTSPEHDRTTAVATKTTESTKSPITETNNTKTTTSVSSETVQVHKTTAATNEVKRTTAASAETTGSTAKLTTTSREPVYTTTTTKHAIVTTTSRAPVYTTTTTKHVIVTTTSRAPVYTTTTTNRIIVTTPFFPWDTGTTTTGQNTTTTASEQTTTTTTTTTVKNDEPKFFDYCRIGDKVYEFAYFTSMDTTLGDYIGMGELYCDPDHIYRREPAYKVASSDMIAVRIEGREVYYDGYYIYRDGGE